MKTLRECLHEAERGHYALGHFNVSTVDGVWAIVKAAQELAVPVVIGVSEGERDFIGVSVIKAIIDSIKKDCSVPIFLNADHTYSFERVKEVIDAGFDSVVVDGSKLPLAENIAMTKQSVDYARASGRDIVVEGELGYIGTSSKLLAELPTGAALGESMTTVEEAEELAHATGIDCLAPAVGNIHGMLKNSPNPRLDIERIKAIKSATGLPLVLHGGSGIVDEDFTSGIEAGISLIHINTELRKAYRDTLSQSLAESGDDVAPYKFLAKAAEAMEEVAKARLKLFSVR